MIEPVPGNCSFLFVNFYFFAGYTFDTETTQWSHNQCALMCHVNSFCPTLASQSSQGGLTIAVPIIVDATTDAVNGEQAVITTRRMGE